MTREEAIAILKPFRDCMVDQHGCPISDAVYALDVALDALSAQQWIPCSERLPDEDYCTGRGIQHSAEVLTTVINHGADDETFVDMMVTVDGEWKTVHPIDGDNDIVDWCEVVAWMPLPPVYTKGET